MELKIGLSPCPNDTYILGSLLNHSLTTKREIAYKGVFHDVEELNEMALRQTLPVSKMSYHAYYHVCAHYDLLDVGSAMGFGNGPLVVTTPQLGDKPAEDWIVGLPGELTTAHFLFNSAYPLVREKKQMLFSDIPPALANGDVDVGVIIHETRFLYEEMGLHLIQDLGNYWEAKMDAPIPLGCFAVHKDLGENQAQQVNADIKASILKADKDPLALLPYIQSHAQEMNPSVIQQHIEMFVNDFSVHINAAGKKAIDALFASLKAQEMDQVGSIDKQYKIIQ